MVPPQPPALSQEKGKGPFAPPRCRHQSPVAPPRAATPARPEGPRRRTSEDARLPPTRGMDLQEPDKERHLVPRATRSQLERYRGGPVPGGETLRTSTEGRQQSLTRPSHLLPMEAGCSPSIPRTSTEPHGERSSQRRKAHAHKPGTVWLETKTSPGTPQTQPKSEKGRGEKGASRGRHRGRSQVLSPLLGHSNRRKRSDCMLRCWCSCKLVAYSVAN